MADASPSDHAVGAPHAVAASPAAPYRLQRVSLALAVAGMGIIDLASALLSHPSDRLLALLRLVPTAVLDTSRTFTLLAGVWLLVTAWGLRRGKRRAFVGALFLCAVSVPVNLLKSVDVEEATVAALLLFALGVSGDAFRVRSRALSVAALRSGAAWFGLGLVVYAVGGAWVIKAVFGHEPSMRLALAEAAYRLFGIGHEVVAVPGSLPLAARRIVAWYLGSLPVLGCVLVLGVAVASLRPASHRRQHRAQAGRVADLLHRHGDGSVSAFAVADENDYFFSANGRAVIAYRFEADTLLAIGDVIGPDEEWPALLRDFETDCRDHDWQFAFFQARVERLPLYRARGWRVLHIGEDPVLHVDRFRLEGSAVGDVRRSSRRARSEGVRIRHFVPASNPFDAVRDPALFESVRAVSAAWLAGRHGEEKSFCMGRFEPRRLPEVWLAVAERADGRVEAFVTWVPIWARRGWALDLMRRRPDAMSGVMELLVVDSVENARSRGDALLSLSLSALARTEPEAGAGAVPSEARESPEALRARTFLMDHLARFYDFQGLFHWKRKFAPEFEPRYLIYPGALALPRVALALVRAQSPGGLRSYLHRPPSTAAR
jgi:phosphatidylglycerol lysyltransferase